MDKLPHEIYGHLQAHQEQFNLTETDSGKCSGKEATDLEKTRTHLRIYASRCPSSERST